MHNTYITFISLASPILISIVLLLCLPFIKTQSTFSISISFLGINIPLIIKRKFIYRFILMIVFFSIISTFAFRDYSSFFPTHYDMEVFFDEKGIKNSFLMYSDNEIKSLKLSSNWRRERREYINKINNDVFKTFKLDNLFDSEGEYIHSTGSTTFFVDKIEGWQTYYIKEGNGQLTHVLEAPGIDTKKFHSTFELLATSNNYFNVTISDIYLKRSKILTPVFKQIARVSPLSDEIIYHHSLIALIKINIFPVCEIGNTIYLHKSKDNKSWFPIGYAIYRPSK